MPIDLRLPDAPGEIDLVEHLTQTADLTNAAVEIEVPVTLRLRVGADGFQVCGVTATSPPDPAVQPPLDRRLVTVLFTDLVDSTRTLASAGDNSWHHTLDDHDAVVRGQLAMHGGREIKQLGDGMLSVFESPSGAIDCATAILERIHHLGLRARAGIHTGEIEHRGADVMGLAVHIASRVIGLARPDEVLVSSVVPTLVAGSAHRFCERGDHELRGIPGRWRLLAVAPHAQRPRNAPSAR